MRRSLLLIIVGGFLLGALAGAGMLILNTDMQPRVATSGKALIGGPFTLVGKDGKTVTDKDFRGSYMLVFFGFTHCPDICPAELQVMAAALDELGRRGRQGRPDLHHPRSRARHAGGRGRLCDEFRAALRRPDRLAGSNRQGGQGLPCHIRKIQEDDGSDDYSVDHSALVYLMGPDGEFITHFPYGTPAAKMAETLRRYL